MVDYEEVLVCAAKMVFASREAARAAAATLDWQHGHKLKAYRCSYCKLWHLSSTY